MLTGTPTKVQRIFCDCPRISIAPVTLAIFPLLVGKGRYSRLQETHCCSFLLPSPVTYQWNVTVFHDAITAIRRYRMFPGPIPNCREIVKVRRKDQMGLTIELRI